MIGKRKYLVWMGHRQASLVQRIEGVACAFVDQTAIDIEQCFVFFLGYDVIVPDFVEQRPHLVIAPLAPARFFRRGKVLRENHCDFRSL